MNIDKHVQKKLTKVMEDPDKKKYAEYVLLVLGGSPKGKAIKEVWPDRYQRAIDRANGNNNLIPANIRKEVTYIERTKICQELYEQSHKSWWINFLEKKNKLYENLYDMALDTDINPRERVSASKVMLEHMPSFQEDINVKVEIKQSKEDFVTQLKDMQRKLQKTAVEDMVVIEVTDVETSK